MRVLLVLGFFVAAVHTASVSKDLEALREVLKELQSKNHQHTTNHQSMTYLRQSHSGAAKEAEYPWPDKKSGDPSRPNVLFIIADDMGWNDIGYHNSEVLTPNLDQLANDGVILNHNYAQAMCTPSRHALLSGKYPYKTGMQHGVLGEDTPYCSPTNNKFLGERFQELGYSTYAVGKWHLGFCQEACLPTNRGFDSFYGCYSGAEGYYDHRPGDKSGYDWNLNGQADWTVDGDYHTYIVNDHAVDKINNHDASEPMFMYLAYTNVHTPLEVPSKYTDMYPDVTEPGRQAYLAMATVMDESIGNIVNTLKDRDMYDNTIIVFTSDNGGEAGGNADNSPLRGGKASMFEGGSRVAGFVHSPLLTRSQYVHDGFFHIVDWTKTLMSIVGGTVEDSVDGYDLSDMIMNGGDSTRRELIYHLDMEAGPIFGQSAVRVNDMKLIWGHPGFVDGYGQHGTVEFFRDPANLALIGLTKSSIDISLSNAARINHDPEIQARGMPSYTPNDIAAIVQLTARWSWNLDNIDSGLVRLFNLADDPYEENDLAQNADYDDEVLELKNYILNLLTDYKAPLAELSQHWHDESSPAKFGGAWSTGWCDSVDLNF